MRFAWFAAVFVVAAVFPVDVIAEDSAESTGGVSLGEPQTQRILIGMKVAAQGGPCRGIYATAPVPFDWPEQEVRIVDEEIGPAVRRIEYRMISGTVRQMLVEIPYLAPGEQVDALVTFEVKRCPALPPDEGATTSYLVPKKVPRQVRPYLGPSPLIESRHARIRTVAKELSATEGTAWEQVEAIYDWVREHVAYQEGPLKGAVQALEDGTGDCEELSSLFIAICRANKIPARTVWVPTHCYPEFYLEDSAGDGHWFPCQAAGTRSFGGIPELRPILQKGDNFRDPDRPRERMRYVSEFLTGKGGRPKVEFIRELVAVPTS